jgi:hypothetical protein
MDNSEQLAFLEQERQKIWVRVGEIEKAINENLTIYEKEAQESAVKASEFVSQTESAKNITDQNLAEVASKLQELRNQFTLFQERKAITDGLYEATKVNSDFIQANHDKVVAQEKNLQEKIAEIEKLLEDKPVLDEKLNKLADIYKRGDEYDSKLSALNNAITERKKEIDKLYYLIIGYKQVNEATGTEEDVPGLKADLEASYTQIRGKYDQLNLELTELRDSLEKKYNDFAEKKEKDYIQTFQYWETEYRNILNKIQALMPNALTTGLSHAYAEKRSVEVDESKDLERTFLRAISGLIGISLIPFALAIYAIFHDTPIETVIARIPREVLAILPLYIPVIWVAYSSNRKMNLSKRLIEEYSHKEVLSKTFEGLSGQINNISDKDISAELRTKLLFTLLEVNSENPGKLISDYNKSDHPLMDTLEKSMKLTESIDKLSKIPGLEKLSQLLLRRSNTKLEGEGKKATDGLELVQNGGTNGS